MGIIFGLLAAATYGAADFIGGRVSRRADVFTVVLLSQLLAAIPLALVIPFTAGNGPTMDALAWGGAAGIAGGTGVLFLYRGLAVGRMTVVAPVTGVLAAAAPVVFGLAIGERPGPVALVGVGIALASVALVSSAPPPDTEADADLTADIPRWKASGMPLAVGAGLSFGAFFILVERAGDDAAIWPLIGMRGASITLVAIVALVLRRSIRPPAGTIVPIGASGVLDIAANVLYLLATRSGLLTLVAVLTSMYPAVTVLLARFLLNERFVRTQLLGLGLAAASIVLIVIG
ncbi:MAG: EamA family transporter [Actinomycetota bacterium]